MREWADLTAARILSSARASNPIPRVLEIGCGTGMLLFRIAPHCEHYTGVDFSTAALAHVQSQLDAQGLRNVSLERLAADELAALAAPGAFDAIVLNSVVQYFPDVDYLVRVLKAAYDRLTPGGVLFVGDVRSLPHLEAFHTAIELARADDATTIADLQARVRRRSDEEGELVVDPRFFERLAHELGDASLVRAELKAGRADNEITRYRYDVVLRKETGALLERPGELLAMEMDAPAPCSLDAIRMLLADAPTSLRILGVPNARLVADVQAATFLASGQVGVTVADVRAATRLVEPGLDPEDARTLNPAYDADIEFNPRRADRMDITFRHRAKAPPVRSRRDPAASGSLGSSYTNRPTPRAVSGGTLIAALRQHARQKLPEYMVPSVFVLLDALPLTPNGKIDRTALPAPDRGRSESGTREPPNNHLEREIVGVLKELVNADQVGIDDNFFDLGANSLLLVQASVRLRTVLGRNVPLVRMFQFPTARSLAASLGAAERADDSAVRQSQDRAEVRKDAMQRMRELRGGRSRA